MADYIYVHTIYIIQIIYIYILKGTNIQRCSCQLGCFAQEGPIPLYANADQAKPRATNILSKGQGGRAKRKINNRKDTTSKVIVTIQGSQIPK